LLPAPAFTNLTLTVYVRKAECYLNALPFSFYPDDSALICGLADLRPVRRAA